MRRPRHMRTILTASSRSRPRPTHRRRAGCARSAVMYTRARRCRLISSARSAITAPRTLNRSGEAETFSRPGEKKRKPHCGRRRFRQRRRILRIARKNGRFPYGPSVLCSMHTERKQKKKIVCMRSLPFSEKEKGAVQGGFLGCNCVKNRDNCTSLLDFPDEI